MLNALLIGKKLTFVPNKPMPVISHNVYSHHYAYKTLQIIITLGARVYASVLSSPNGMEWHVVECIENGTGADNHRRATR